MGSRGDLGFSASWRDLGGSIGGGRLERILEFHWNWEVGEGLRSFIMIGVWVGFGVLNFMEGFGEFVGVGMLEGI